MLNYHRCRTSSNGRGPPSFGLRWGLRAWTSAFWARPGQHRSWWYPESGAQLNAGPPPHQGKAHQSSLPNSGEGPKFFLARARWSIWAWSRAKLRRSRRAGLRGTPRGGLLMWALLPRRWFPLERTRIPFLESPPGYYLFSACTAQKWPLFWCQERRNTAGCRHLSPSEPCVIAPLRRRERRFECRSATPSVVWGLQKATHLLPVNAS